jgi:hypothetical protein
MKYLYGIFLPTDYPGYSDLPQNRKWAMRSTKVEAKSVVKAFPGASIRRMLDPESGVWDMTTFTMLSETI